MGEPSARRASSVAKETKDAKKHNQEVKKLLEKLK